MLPQPQEDVSLEINAPISPPWGQGDNFERSSVCYQVRIEAPIAYSSDLERAPRNGAFLLSPLARPTPHLLPGVNSHRNRLHQALDSDSTLLDTSRRQSLTGCINWESKFGRKYVQAARQFGLVREAGSTKGHSQD